MRNIHSPSVTSASDAFSNFYIDQQNHQQPPLSLDAEQQKAELSDNRKKPANLFINTEIPQFHVQQFPGHASAPTHRMPEISDNGKDAPSMGGRKQNASPAFVTLDQLNPVMNSDGSEVFEARINSRMEGGFFYDKNVLTCYRRNYFRVIGMFQLVSLNNPFLQILPEFNIPLYVASSNGVPMRVREFKLAVSATSNHPNLPMVELVTHINKRDSNARNAPQPKTCCPGGTFDDPAPPKSPLNANKAIRTNPCPISIAFDRIQFRQATSNNGKRAAIQQFFAVQLELQAICMDGSVVPVARITSEDLVVRGRSPSHYKEKERENGDQNSAMLLLSPASTIYSPYSAALPYTPYRGPMTARPATPPRTIISQAVGSRRSSLSEWFSHVPAGGFDSSNVGQPQMNDLTISHDLFGLVNSASQNMVIREESVDLSGTTSDSGIASNNDASDGLFAPAGWPLDQF